MFNNTPINTMGIHNTMGMNSASMDFKTGNHYYDMILITLMSTFITSLVATLTEFNKGIMKLLVIIFEKIMEKIKKYNLKNLNEVIIEHKINDQDPKINNKILINSILYDFTKGNKYKIDNREIDTQNYNDYEREKNRELIFIIDDTFNEDDIEINYQLVTKKIQAQNQIMDKKKPNGAIDNSPQVSDGQLIDVPCSEKITLISKKSIDYISKYVERKRIAYIEKFCAKDNKIYIYPPTGYGNVYVEFNKLKFESKKTFDSWFSPHKDKITKIINDFSNKKGIYSLSSIPYKAGFLLYGEPGCGKTSFIKALANELNRCVIPIFLDKFTNVSSFKELFQTEYIFIKDRTNTGAGGWVYLPMNKRIIVFEEIDTAGTIVMDRTKLKELVKRKKEDGDNKKIVEKIMENYKHYEQIKNETGFIKSNLCSCTTCLNGGDCQTLGQTGPTMQKLMLGTMERVETKPKNKKIDFENDELDEEILDRSLKHRSGLSLGDILDTLDGLCEASGLVYVITTNHIDFLDPALIRPGRISYSANLCEMKFQEIKLMLIYYYVTNDCHNDKISEEGKFKLIDVIAKHLDSKYKPSKLEELCKNNSLNELFKELKNL